jgi:hypothetical protein
MKFFKISSIHLLKSEEIELVDLMSQVESIFKEMNVV